MKDKKQQLRRTFTLDAETMRLILAEAQRNRSNASQTIRQIVAEWHKQKEKKNERG